MKKATKKTATKKKVVKAEPTKNGRNVDEAVKEEQPIEEKIICWLKTPCATKVIGVVLISLGWLGTYLECMGKFFAIPLLVIGIALFANGIKDEIVNAIEKK